MGYNNRPEKRHIYVCACISVRPSIAPDGSFAVVAWNNSDLGICDLRTRRVGRVLAGHVGEIVSSATAQPMAGM